MKKKRKGVKNTAPKCPYCGSHTIFRSAEGIYHKNPEREMLYVCKNYPTCDAYVRVHRGTRIPMGVPANWSSGGCAMKHTIISISFIRVAICPDRMPIIGWLISCAYPILKHILVILASITVRR